MASSLFFAGSVEEAVHKSIQEKKYFVAFVTDEDEESNNWEFAFLPELHDFLSERGVTLRIIKGSQAAANLASLFPIPKLPTIVIIHQGQMKAYLTSGLSREAFFERANEAFGKGTLTPDLELEPASPESQSEASAYDDTLYKQDDPATSLEPPTAAQIEADGTAATDREQASIPAEGEGKKAGEERGTAEEEVRRGQEEADCRRVDESTAQKRRQLEERRRQDVARREASRDEESQRAQKAREEGDARRRAAAEEEAKKKKHKGDNKPKLSPAEQAHRDQVLRQKQEVEDERRRIMAQIQTDKADRRKRQEALRMNREDIKKKQAEAAATEEEERRKRKKVLGISSPDGDTCALQVRLLDGSLIRARFGGSSTVKEHVRQWVDNEMLEKDSSLREPPSYQLKMILTPKPNATIQDNDEVKSVVELGMAPTATLVVVPDMSLGVFDNKKSFPVQLMLFLLAVWAWMKKLWQMVIGLFKRDGVRGRGEQTPEEGGCANGNEADRSVPQGKSTSLVDRGQAERRRTEQYYNGNSTAFESRPDEDEN